MPTAPGPPGRSSGAFICRCQSQTPRPVPTRQARTLGRSAGVRVLSLLWQGPFWVRSPEWWRLALSVSLFALACALSWTAARALGRHLRIDASVDFTHELVRSGPYRLVRHPIYTSMLCVLLGTGVLISPLYLLLPAVLIFLIGTEIRMQVEDRMLVSRFGEQFTAYQHNVSGLIPFLKCPTAGLGQPPLAPWRVPTDQPIPNLKACSERARILCGPCVREIPPRSRLRSHARPKISFPSVSTTLPPPPPFPHPDPAAPRAIVETGRSVRSLQPVETSPLSSQPSADNS